MDQLIALFDDIKGKEDTYTQYSRVAIVGRPNVGKSSLLNKMAKENRSLVSAVPGTTRDPVDEIVNLGGKTWHFVDTAGIRKDFDSHMVLNTTPLCAHLQLFRGQKLQWLCSMLRRR